MIFFFVTEGLSSKLYLLVLFLICFVNSAVCDRVKSVGSVSCSRCLVLFVDFFVDCKILCMHFWPCLFTKFCKSHTLTI